MIDRVEIDCEEDGFHLILSLDEIACENPDCGWLLNPDLNLRLSQDAALQLREQVREKIDPWWAEAEGVRADFERHQRTGQLPPYVRDLDHAIEQDEGERLREAGDLERKRRRES